jgi:succinoglycan biosynthesis transport protein ExoP
LRVELSKQSTRLQQEISTLTARHAVLVAKVAEDRKRVDALAGLVARYDLLQKAVEAAQEIYNQELRRVVSAETAENITRQPLLVTTIDAPSRPDPAEPRRPIIWLNMLIAAVSGLVLALVYAFLADHFDHSIKSIDGAERYLGTPVLASVPKLGRGIIRTK